MDKNKCSDIVTGDETSIYFFEPQRKVCNKIWATSSSTRPCVAKRSKIVWKVMYAVFFTIYGPAIQVAVPMGYSVTALFYRDKVLKNLKSYDQN